MFFREKELAVEKSIPWTTDVRYAHARSGELSAFRCGEQDCYADGLRTLKQLVVSLYTEFATLKT
jgi:hypothetical protein